MDGAALHRGIPCPPTPPPHYAPVMGMKVERLSVATARASSVFPDPGGPNSRIPRGGWRIPVKRSGRSDGSTVTSCTAG